MRHLTKTNTKDVKRMVKDHQSQMFSKLELVRQITAQKIKQETGGKAKKHVKTRQGLPSTKKSEIIFKLISLLMRSTSGVALFMLRL